MKNETTIIVRTLTGLQGRLCLRRQYVRTHRQRAVKRYHLLNIHYETHTHTKPDHTKRPLAQRGFVQRGLTLLNKSYGEKKIAER